MVAHSTTKSLKTMEIEKNVHVLGHNDKKINSFYIYLGPKVVPNRPECL